MSTVDSSIYCSVPGCSSWRNNNPEIIFHEFPDVGKNKVYCKTEENKIEFMDRQKAWRTQLKIESEDTKYMKVCCLHFVDNDYMKIVNNERRILKKTSVPSQNLPQLSDISSNQNTDRGNDEPAFISLPTDGSTQGSPQQMDNSDECMDDDSTRPQTKYMREYRKRKRQEMLEKEARISTERTRDMRARLKKTILACALPSEEVTVNDFQPTFSTCHRVLPKIRGRRIIDLQYFFEKLQTIGSHGTRRACSIGTLSIVREIAIGLNSDVQLYCNSCNTNFTMPISDPVLTNLAEVNRSAVAGTVAAGSDYSGLAMLFSNIGIPTMTEGKFQELMMEDHTTEMKAEDREEEMVHKPVEVFIKEGDDSDSCDIQIKEEVL